MAWFFIHVVITPNFHSAGTSVLDRMLFMSKVRTLVMTGEANLRCSAVMFNVSEALLLCMLATCFLMLLSDDGCQLR